MEKNYYDAETKTMNYFTEPVIKGWETDHEKINSQILADFYTAVHYILSKNYDEYMELISRTTDPASNNMFYPLREYRVKRNGHYKQVNIYSRFWGGCWIEEKELR